MTGARCVDFFSHEFLIMILYENSVAMSNQPLYRIHKLDLNVEMHTMYARHVMRPEGEDHS